MDFLTRKKEGVQPAVKQYGFNVKTPEPPPKQRNISHDKAHRDENSESDVSSPDFLVRRSWEGSRARSHIVGDWAKYPFDKKSHAIDSWENRSNNIVPYPSKESRQSSEQSDRRSSEKSTSSEEWALGARWRRDSDSPQALGVLEAELQPRESLIATSAFNGFKDSCEAGRLSLGPSQVVQESGRLEVVGTLHTSEGVRNLVKSVIGGLRAWQQPEASSEGLGGTYFFMDEKGNKKAIVKPCDEEPMAPNNPKGFVGRALGEPGLKPTVRVGEAAMREVAAFLLDHNQFANVPHTVLVRVTHNCFHTTAENNQLTSRSEELSSSMNSSTSNTMAFTVRPQIPAKPASKLASLQEFISHDGDSSEMGCSRFSAKDVHRIGILDLRLFNTDRHAGNMLVKRTKAPKTAASSAHSWLEDRLELIPIDHGFCLPEALEAPYFEWLHWPQANIPFDEEELAYIANLDANSDVIFLQQELPWLPEGSLRTLQIATMLLKKCAAAGMTLSEIGNLVSRPLVGLDEEPSELEKVCMTARQKVEFNVADTEIPEEEEERDLDPLDDLITEHEDAGGKEDEGTLLGGRTSLVMGHQMRVHSTLSGDEMLFDLEEGDETSEESSTASSTQSSPVNLSSNKFLMADRPVHSSTLSATGALPMQKLGTKPEGGGDMAKSMHTGFHSRALRSRNRRMRMSTRNNRPSPLKPREHNAYPPPVVGGTADAMNNVFEGLDKTSWLTFLSNVEDAIQENLDDGVWQGQDESKSSNVGYGVSCPRF